MRELAEETGTDKAEFIAESRDWLSYDLPPEIAAQTWGGRYRGQRQKWFAARFTGSDGDIRLDAHIPEFVDWRWLTATELERHIIDFKRPLYRAVFVEFRDLIGSRG